MLADADPGAAVEGDVLFVFLALVCGGERWAVCGVGGWEVMMVLERYVVAFKIRGIAKCRCWRYYDGRTQGERKTHSPWFGRPVIPSLGTEC